MDRDELIGNAADFYLTRRDSDIAVTTDFALGMYEAGRRAERERIANRLDGVEHEHRAIGGCRLCDFIGELRQTEPAESGE